MKCIYVIQKLFFFNLLSLLWWPYFCDIKQNGANPQGIQNSKDSNDPRRITNVPTKQDESGEQPNLGLEQTLKENVVQSSVEFVNNEAKVKDVKDATKEATFPNVPESFQQEGSPELLRKKFVSNLDSSREVHVNSEKQDATVVKKNHIDGETEQQINNSPENPVEESSVKIDATLTSQLEAMPVTITISTEKPKKILEEEMAVKLPSLETLDVGSSVTKDGAEKIDHPKLPIDAASFAETIDSPHHHPQYDGMPSFDEWKKMMLAEQEKGGQKMPSPGPPGKKISSQKRRRNYSSYECGAKIVAANSEAEGTSRILNELVDEYMLNPCKAKIWFVIELCETVQASQIELANFELFSSCPKDFVVYSSDNFPTRDWALLGTFSTAEQRVLQSFELKQEGFGKFIKIELLSHYGKEHYCPLSVVRIFGTSMVDEYEEMETLASHPHVPDDDLDRLDIQVEDQGSTNIFGSATDAVLNMVKKAAQALGQHQPPEDAENNDTSSDQQNISDSKLCKHISSTNKCEDMEVKNETDSAVSTLIDAAVSPSSVHQSLFRHLHRCDQCVSSHLGYYSPAQPHCRFFQAALGPVMFKALCDWFKEHPLVIAHNVPVNIGHSIDGISGSILTISPTKSPPPQIMTFPLENDSSLTVLTLNDSSPSTLSKLDKSLTVDITNISRTRLNKTIVVPDKVKLEPSIQPTKTIQDDKMLGRNDSASAPKFEKSSEVPQFSADTTSNIATEIKPTVPEKTEVLTENKSPKTEMSSASIISSELEVSNDTVDTKITDIEEEQMNEMLIDANAVTPEELISVESVSSSELPLGFKTDDKFPEMRGELQGKPEPVTISGITSASAGQKESVFMRMSNRIKSLEINMSLSGQYLQELSQRYRRQMEDMQRAFNRTIGTLNDTARKAAEKDLKQQEIINNLQLQVANLTETVELLMNERTSVFRQMIETHLCLMVVEAIVMITIMSLCVRRISSSAQSIMPAEKDTVMMSPRNVSKRRSSADSSTPPIARKVTKRSSSEEAIAAGKDSVPVKLLPVLIENVQKVKKKNRKRNRGLHSSILQPTVQPMDPSPTSSSLNFCSENKRNSYSDESLLTHAKSTQATYWENHVCENCDNKGPISYVAAKTDEKERRTHVAPLQNLTNGTIKGLIQSSSQPRSNSLVKEKFSFKKFLKFQKRDSI